MARPLTVLLPLALFVALAVFLMTSKSGDTAQEPGTGHSFGATGTRPNVPVLDRQVKPTLVHNQEDWSKALPVQSHKSRRSEAGIRNQLPAVGETAITDAAIKVLEHLKAPSVTEVAPNPAALLLSPKYSAGSALQRGVIVAPSDTVVQALNIAQAATSRNVAVVAADVLSSPKPSDSPAATAVSLGLNSHRFCEEGADMSLLESYVQHVLRNGLAFAAVADTCDNHAVVQALTTAGQPMWQMLKAVPINSTSTLIVMCRSTLTCPPYIPSPETVRRDPYPVEFLYPAVPVQLPPLSDTAMYVPTRTTVQTLIAQGAMGTQVATRTEPEMGKVQSAQYWENRYKSGDTSGAGSYGQRAQFKAKVVNAFVAEFNIQSVVEFGVGDGNQLTMGKYASYVGVDVSRTIVEKVKLKFKDDPTKSFLWYENMAAPGSLGLQAHMAMSLEVIFHLTERQVIENYLAHLCITGSHYLVIMSSNTENEIVASHVHHWPILALMKELHPEWHHFRTVMNPLKDMFSHFFMFCRPGLSCNRPELETQQGAMP